MHIRKVWNTHRLRQGEYIHTRAMQIEMFSNVISIPCLYLADGIFNILYIYIYFSCKLIVFEIIPSFGNSDYF